MRAFRGLNLVERKFVQFSDKKYREMLYKPEHNQLKDPLNILVDMGTKPRMMEILYQIEKGQQFMPNVINIGSLMYHMGATGAESEYVSRRIEDKLVELQGAF